MNISDPFCWRARGVRLVDDEAQKSGSIFQFEPSELIKPAIATAIVVFVRVLLSVFKWHPQMPDFLTGTLNAEQLINAIAGAVWLVIVLTIFSWKRWRSRRRHVQGRVNPGKAVIRVAELERDGKKGEHRTNIVHTLKQELGESVQVLRAGVELRAEEAGDATEEAVGANRTAQAFLQRHKGSDDLGKGAESAAGVIELRFASTADAAPAAALTQSSSPPPPCQ
jgi:hypothetical protein